MGNIIWLASYPKSGNTWLRILLANYWRDGDTPASINELTQTPIASSRDSFAEMAGVEASDLSAEEIIAHRPAVYERMATNADNTLFLKAHDSYRCVTGERALFAPRATAGAIYLVRNPFDVAVSLAAHSGRTLDQTVGDMADSNFAFDVRHGLGRQLRQEVGSWHEHVCSWLKAERDMPLCLVRYEDLVERPVQIFGSIVRFIDQCTDGERTRSEKPDSSRVKKAVAFSHFKHLQQQEREVGFQERSTANKTFFRRGKAGGWRDDLTAQQVGQLIINHGATMERLGYLTQDGAIVYP